MEEEQKLPYQTVILQDESLRQFQGGFTAIPNRILRNSSLSIGARLTYAMLLKYAWQDDFCWPAQTQIAKDLGLKERMTRYHLEELKRNKLITWKRQGLQRPNIYYILKLPDMPVEKNPEKQKSFSTDRQYIAGPKRQYTSAQDRQLIAYNEDSEDKYITNVNVGLIKKDGKNDDENDSSGNDRETLLVKDLMEELGDRNPRSKATFRKIVAALGDDVVYRLLGNTKEAYREGIVSGSKRAAYFVGMANNVAAELGVDIGFKTKNGQPLGNGNQPSASYPINGMIAGLADLKSGFRDRARSLTVKDSTK